MKGYFIILILLVGCTQHDLPMLTPPSVTTADATSVLCRTAVSGGDVINAGGDVIRGRGVAWDTLSNPTYEVNMGYTSDSTGIGSFTSDISDLQPNTTYFLRAYVRYKNTFGYGDEKTFTTFPLPKDILPSSSGVKWQIIQTTVDNDYLTISAYWEDQITNGYWARAIFKIKKENIKNNTTIEIAPNVNGSTWSYHSDNAGGPDIYYATSGTISIDSVTNSRIWGIFNLKASALPITGKFNGIPFYNTFLKDE
jgi:hypothetical protein